MAEDTEQVAWLRGLKAPAKNVQHIDFEAFVRLLADGYHSGRAEYFEWLSAARLGCVYFDVDAKRCDTDEATLMANSRRCLADFFGDIPTYDFDTDIVIATSHGEAKWSIRFYNDSVVATPRDIKKRIQLLNLGASRGGVFDEAPYSCNQKLRAVGSIKAPDDPRRLRLVDDDTLDDAALRARLARTVVQQTPEHAQPLPQPTMPPRSHKRKEPVAPDAPPQPPPFARVARAGGRRKRPAETDKPELTRLLEEAGFVSVAFLEQPRPDSLTFAARNRGDGLGQCPCCDQDHERQNWWATKQADGRYYVKSYSTRCKGLVLGAALTFVMDEEAETEPTDMGREVVEVRRDVAALSTRVEGLSQAFRDFVEGVAPAIMVESEGTIDAGSICPQRRCLPVPLH